VAVEGISEYFGIKCDTVILYRRWEILQHCHNEFYALYEIYEYRVYKISLAL